jgi:DNA-binding beta-propeller fold protein YncE
MSRRYDVTGVALAAGLCAAAPAACAQPSAPLVLEKTIALDGVAGRIDHLAIDPTRKRLLVAELGNGSVEAVDLATGQSAGRIRGLKEPQGLAYIPGLDQIAVASGGDGSVRFYRAADLAFVGAVDLGDDADNIRLDPASGRIIVGYGAGALAVIDPAKRQIVGRIALSAHPESFQIDGARAYVNLPNAGVVAAVDLGAARVTATWSNQGRQWNFPMALDRGAGEVAVVYRLPARMVVFDTASGKVKQSAPTCGDADDVFLDGPRRRLYVTCGSGSIDVFAASKAGYAPLGRVSTRGGARTSIFDPALGRLFVAAPRQGAGGAAILIYQPKP